MKLTRLTRRAVVIGSGFGGGVSALRLTQAGVAVTVLEQGRRWPAFPNCETFPHATSPDRRALFYGSSPVLFGRPVSLDPYVGLFNAVVTPTMTVMSGNGYGGGSLTYQGMTLEPDRDVLAAHFPSAVDPDEMHRRYYPRVARMLRTATAPDALLDSPPYAVARLFARKAVAAGYEAEKIPMPIDWRFALDELAGRMKPSYTNGDCGIGVNNGGKHSVDVTYLAAAERTGRLEVLLQHRVTDVARARDGRWQVSVDVTDETGTTRAQKIITTRALIFGAGSGGTTRLLLKASGKGLVPDLPDALGAGWGTNADRIYLWADLTDDWGPVEGGPVVVGSKDWSDPSHANTVIQASIPPVLLGGEARDLHTTVMVGYGVSEARGRWVYDPVTDDGALLWPKDGDAAIQTSRIGPRTANIAGAGSLLVDTNAVVPSTWHPMGGANMGSVCDHEGRVLGQRGLYVLDGALLPGNAAACNPSMTIAAVAERAMDRIVGHDVGSLI